MSETSDSAPSLDDEGLFPVEDGDRLDLSAVDIEAAYERALQAVSAAERAIPEAITVNQDPESPAGSKDASNDDRSGAEAAPSVPTSSSPTPDNEASLADDGGQRTQPRSIVEAALFVGGSPLTSKRLARMLGDESAGAFVEELITSLNAQYVDEERPYEIRLGEGGYQLALRTEFDRVRNRVFGTNPKDVKLSQEALEVLAFVAYRQPVGRGDLEDAGKANAATVLRQLLRRQLIHLERGDPTADEVTYSTSPRFLEVFGLRNLNELPLPEDLLLK